MAAQQNKPQEITINLKAEVQKLKELRDTIQDLKQEGKLANTNENTYKSLFTQIEQTIKRMNEAVRDGAIGAKGLQNIQKGFDNITESISKMVNQEKSTGLGMKEYLKDLQATEKAVETLKTKIKNFQQEQSKLNINEKGSLKKGQEGDVMAAAREASRAKRDNKGADTKAEKMLKAGDFKAIQEGAAAGDKDAQKALQLFNEELERQRTLMSDLTDKIEEYKERLSYAKNTLAEVRSTAAFDEEAVDQLEEAGKQFEEMGKKVEVSNKLLEATGQGFVNTGNSANNAGNAIGKAAKKFVTVNAALKIIKKLIKEGVEAVIEMDKALTDMSIVTGESRENLQKMIPTFNELGRATGATSTEVAHLTAEYMKQGRTMQDSLIIAEQTAKAAKISGISTADSVQYMTSAINGFNLAAKDAEHVSDVFAKLGAASATDYKDLAIALSKVSAQANTAGMSFEFTTTLLAKGLEVTQEAPESIGTALKTVIARMRELSDYGSTLEDGMNVNKMEGALAAVGISLRDTNGQFRDLEEIFNELGPKWDSLNTMQQQSIAQAAAGTRQQSRFLAIMQDWDRTVELGNQALQAEGATMYQHAKYAESLEFSINKMQTAWQGFVSGLTDSDLIKTAFSWIAEVVSGLADVINKLNEWTNGFAGTAFTLSAVGAAIYVSVRDIYNSLKATREEKRAQLEYQRQQVELQRIQIKLLRGEQLTEEEKLTLEKKKQNKLQEDAIKNKEDEVKQEKNLIKAMKDGTKEGEKKYIDRKQKNAAKHKAKAEKAEREGNAKAAKKERDKEAKEMNKAANVEKKRREKDKKAEQKQKEKQLKKEKKEKEKNAKLEKQTQDDKLKAQNEINVAKDKEQKATNQLNQSEVVGNVQKENAAQTEKDITQEKQDQNKQTVQGLPGEVASGAIQEEKKDDTKEETKEEKEQLVVQGAKNAAEGAELAIKKKSLKETVKQKIEDIQGAIVKTGKAVAEAYAQLGPIGGSIAAVATVAVIAGIIGAAIGNAANGARKEKISENQDKIYENREKKTEIDNTKAEYEELYNKKNKTQEEIDRLAEIESQMGENYDEFKGLTGDQLIQAMEAKSKALEDENRKLIVDTWNETQKGAKSKNFWGKSRAEDYLLSAEGRVARNEYAALQIEDYAKNNVAEEYQAEVMKSAQTMFSSLTDADIQKMLDSGKSAEEVTEYITNFGTKTAEVAANMAMAGDESRKAAAAARESGDIEAARKLESKAFVDELEEYNKQIAAAADDPQLKEALQTQYRGYQLLSTASENVANALEKGVLVTSITALAEQFDKLGLSADTLGMVLDSLKADKDGNYSVEELATWTDEKWAEAASKSGKKWEDMDEDERKQFKNSIYDVVVEQSSNGITAGNIDDYRTNISSNIENVRNVKEAILDGDLSQDDQKFLKENYASLYSSKEFQDALTNGDTSRAAEMLEQEEAKQREGKIASANNAAKQNEIAFKEKYGISYDDFISGNTEGMSATDIAAATQAASDIQYLKDSAKALEEYKYEYEGLNAEVQEAENNTKKLDAIQKKIDDRGFGLASEYAAMADIAQQAQDKAQKDFNDTMSDMNDRFGAGIAKIDEATGALVVDMKEYNALSAYDKKLFDEKLEVLKEQNDTLEAQKDKVKEIADMERENQVEIQNQAIAAMQARLDAEYEATQQSLDKRRDLYNKYFDSLDQEAETEDYENDRQALLNKIASLSTATDSESLAKLKEAQEALADLDDEQLQSERDMRREAVEESFDQQGEQLDAAYENAMSDVQGMWEEFCSMAGEDQLALFQQYGEGFQEVTDLQKEMAMETLQSTMEAIASYGFVGVNPTPKPAYAEGGIVDFTGPAWVDGSKTKPEAFLDPEDTANISALAQGLRAIVGNIFGPKDEPAKTPGELSDATLNIEEFNINVGIGNNLLETGEKVADGFMKAIRELGININKKG